MRVSPLKIVVVLALLAGIYGVFSWIYLWPGFHFAQAEMRRWYHGISYETQHYKSRVFDFANHAEDIKKSDVIFLGDSITEGFDLNTYIHHSGIVNLGISGDTTYGVLNRLGQLDNNNNAIVFLMIGVNDLGVNESIDDIKNNVATIIDDLKSKDLYLIVQSVLLTDGRKRDNDKISLLNKELIKLSKQEDITYLDLNPFLVKNDKLNSEFTYDGLHLNEAGYKAWAHVINVFLNAMIKE